MSQVCLEARNITKSFDGRSVVSNLSFSVEKGQVFGLLGHNGAGKSTTIDLLLGLKKSDSGTALMFGKEASKHRKEVFERVGVQLQSSNYQAAIRVDELCQEHAALYTDAEDYHELLRKFGLSGFEKSMVMKLSGGERQKLSVVLSLLGKPEVVFLDELTTGLDVASRREVWRTLKNLKDNGLTIFLTTHYMEEAENLCDKVILLKSGRKVAEGTVAEVVKASPYKNLEEAYLWYMDEEVEL